MAAVLCQSIAGVCKSLVYAITCPFYVCGDCCEGVGNVLASPFTPYLLTTLGLNIPCIIWGVRAGVGVVNEEIRCKGDVWLWVNAGLSVIHMWAAFYIVSRVQDERRRAEEASSGSVSVDSEDADSWKGGAQAQDGSFAVSPSNGAKTNYRNLAHSHSTSPNSSKGSGPAKPTTLGDKMLYTMASSASIPAIAGTKSWKERASREVVLGEDDDEGEANSLQRLRQVFCYDVVVALYMMTVIFWCVWQCIGIARLLLYNHHDDNNYNQDELCNSIEYWKVLSILCSFMFMMLVFVTFSCSLLCMRY